MDELRCPRCDSDDVEVKRSSFGAWKIECNYCHRKTFSHLTEREAVKQFSKQTNTDRTWLLGFHMGVKMMIERMTEWGQSKCQS